MHAADLAHRTRLPHLTWLGIPHGVATAERRNGTDNRVFSHIRQGPIRPERTAVRSPGERMSRSALRERAETAEGWEVVSASGALARWKELEACWAPVHVVVTEVAC